MTKFDELYQEKIKLYEAQTTNPFNRVQPNKDAEIDPATGKPKIANPMSAPAPATPTQAPATAPNQAGATPAAPAGGVAPAGQTQGQAQAQAQPQAPAQAQPLKIDKNNIQQILLALKTAAGNPEIQKIISAATQQ